MNLHFESNQEYQLQAIQSVVDVFEGQPLNNGDFEFSLSGVQTSLQFSEYGAHFPHRTRSTAELSAHR